jgi:hypothetical protein
MTSRKLPAWMWAKPIEGCCGRPTDKKSRPFCTRTTEDGGPCDKHRTRAERYQLEKAKRVAHKAVLAEVGARGGPACHEWEPLPRPYPEPRGNFTRVEWVLHLWQRDRCAICGATYGPGELRVDHDHNTDAVRGYLCAHCNATEALSASPVFERYRQRPPTAILGLQGRYGDPIGDDGDWPDGNKSERWWASRDAKSST